MVYVFWRVIICRGNLEPFLEQKKLFKGSPVKFLVKTVARGNAVQFTEIFPPKDLVYIGRKTLSHL